MRSYRLSIITGITIAACGFAGSSALARNIDSQPELIHGHAAKDWNQIRMAVVQAREFDESNREWIDNVTSDIADLIREHSASEDEVESITREWHREDLDDREIARVRAIAQRHQLTLPQDTITRIARGFVDVSQQQHREVDNEFANYYILWTASVRELFSEAFDLLSIEETRPSIDQLAGILIAVQNRLIADYDAIGALHGPEAQEFIESLLNERQYEPLSDEDMDTLMSRALST